MTDKKIVSDEEFLKEYYSESHQEAFFGSADVVGAHSKRLLKYFAKARAAGRREGAEKAAKAVLSYCEGCEDDGEFHTTLLHVAAEAIRAQGEEEK